MEGRMQQLVRREERENNVAEDGKGMKMARSYAAGSLACEPLHIMGLPFYPLFLPHTRHRAVSRTRGLSRHCFFHRGNAPYGEFESINKVYSKIPPGVGQNSS